VPPGTFDQNGHLIAVKIAGTATVSNDAGTKALTIDMAIPSRSTVRTGTDSELIVSFSNGTILRLGADTEIVVEEFLQDLFAGAVRVVDLVEEPSPSRTTLEFMRGDIVVTVKRLKVARGSTFTIRTPVGWAQVIAADEGDTIFRVDYRPKPQPEGTKNALRITAIAGRVTLATPEGGKAEASPTSTILVAVDPP
jgi:hypothetical protein